MNPAHGGLHSTIGAATWIVLSTTGSIYRLPSSTTVPAGRYLRGTTAYGALAAGIFPTREIGAANCAIQNRQVGPHHICDELTLAIGSPANCFLQNLKN